MERVPGIARALKFYQLGLRYEGALEWRWTTRGLSDKELIAAAEVARLHGWYERSIDTADRTQTAARLRSALSDALPRSGAAVTASSSISTKPGFTAWSGRRAGSPRMHARAQVPWG